MRAWKALIIGVGLGLLIAPSLTATAGEPTETLRTVMDRVFGVLGDPALRGADNVQARRTRVFSVAEQVFDFGETARLSLGRHWEARSEAERQEFVRLFMRLIEISYIANIELYDGETILYTDETIEGDRATVRTRIVTKQGGETSAAFLMRRKPGDHWRIYDVNVEGVSITANYRAQFNRVISSASYEELVRRLRAKQMAPVATLDSRN